MTVFFASAVVLLFYICAMPVKFALMLHLGMRAGFGAGISVFEGRFALNGARDRALGIKKHLPWKKDTLNLEKKHALAAAWHTGKYLAQHAQLEHLRCEGSISLSDAAHTALLCGGANSLNAALQPLMPGRVKLNLHPQFSASRSNAALYCIVSVQLGHIIVAALIGARHYLTGRIAHGKTTD